VEEVSESDRSYREPELLVNPRYQSQLTMQNKKEEEEAKKRQARLDKRFCKDGFFPSRSFQKRLLGYDKDNTADISQIEQE